MSKKQHTFGGRPDWTILLGLSFAGMTVAMMQTLVVPILGLMQHKLGVSAGGISWVVTANLLAAAVMTPLLGRYGDQHGKRKVLLACLILMLGGSLLAATTSSLALLIAGRVLQGAAAGIFPLAISVLRDEIATDKLPSSMAIVSATLSVGGGIGLVATGLLTTGGDDYHNVFWLAFILSAAALVGVFVLVPDPHKTSPGRTDVAGALTLGLTLVLLLMPLSQGSAWGWSSPATIGCLVGSVLMAALWVRVERQVDDPLVDMDMFLHRPVLITNIAGLLLGFAMFGQFLGTSGLVQIPPSLAGYGFGASVLKASVAYLLPGALFGVIAAPVGGRLVRRFGGRVVLAIGTVIGTISFVCFALLHDHPWQVIGAGILASIAVSFAFAAMPALLVAAVPISQTGIANGINSIARAAGSSIAGAAIATILLARHVPNLPPGVPNIPAESGFTAAFAIAAVCCATACAVVLIGLPKHRPVVVVADSSRALADLPS
ncbi:MAG: MFS transporter [Mycobacteriaceae bacterium]